MRILSLTAGAASMYCGSCLRDNALARELIRQGHDVMLVPIYTPTLVDGENVSRDHVLFGGISVYLQQHSKIFRHTPAFVDRLWDSMPALRMAARRSIATEPRMLGELTVSMLEGEKGVLRKEFLKLRKWIRETEPPDIINLPNSMLIALAKPLREEFQRPVCCTLQGEDLFLDGLTEPYRSRAMELIRSAIQQVDAFISPSRFYATYMSDYLSIPGEKIHHVPLGLDPSAFSPSFPLRDETKAARIGFLARIAPEKGLHLLADAYIHLRRELQWPEARLEAAGYLGPDHHGYLEKIQTALTAAGLAEEFHYHGEVDHPAKLRFLESIDIFAAPAIFEEPKGLFLLEAWAAGLPVVATRRGALPEMVEATGGGILVEPDNPAAMAQGLQSLLSDPARARDLGQAGAAGLTRHYHVTRMAARTLEIYQAISRSASPAQSSARQ